MGDGIELDPLSILGEGKLDDGDPEVPHPPPVATHPFHTSFLPRGTCNPTEVRFQTFFKGFVYKSRSLYL